MRFVLITLILLLTLLAAGAVFVFSRFSVLSSHRGYKEAVAAYREAGLPWTEADLMGEELPDDVNAVRVYAAIETIGSSGSPPPLPPRLTELMSQKDLPQVQSYLKQKQQALATLEAARSLGAQWSRYWSLRDPSERALYQQLSGWTEDLALRAELSALKGHRVGVVSDLTLVAKIADDLLACPHLDGVHQGIEVRKALMKAILRCASLMPEDEALIHDLSILCADMAEPIELRPALKGEAYSALQELRVRNLAPQPFDRFEEKPRPQDLQGDPPEEVSGLFNRSYAVRTLSLFAGVLTKAGRSGQREFEEACRSMSAPLESWEEWALIENPDGARKREFWKKLDAGWQADRFQRRLWGMPETAASAQAQAAVHQVVLELHLSRLKGVAFDPLGLPRDPFGGDALRTHLGKPTLKAWSLGPDRDDDRGIESVPEMRRRLKEGDPPRPIEPRNGDIVAEFPWRRMVALR